MECENGNCLVNSLDTKSGKGSLAEMSPLDDTCNMIIHAESHADKVSNCLYLRNTYREPFNALVRHNHSNDYESHLTSLLGRVTGPIIMVLKCKPSARLATDQFSS